MSLVKSSAILDRGHTSVDFHISPCLPTASLLELIDVSLVLLHKELSVSLWRAESVITANPKYPHITISPEVPSTQGLLEYGRISFRILTDALILISIVNWTVAAYEQLRCVFFSRTWKKCC